MLCVGEAFGADEAAERKPFVGYSGKELWLMLGEAMPDIDPEAHADAARLHHFGNAWVKRRERWLQSAGIAYTNVFNFRPPANKLENISVPKSELPKGSPALSLPALTKGRYLVEEFLPELDRLYEEIVLAQPNVIIALGATAAWAILGATSISAIRGTAQLAQLGPDGQFFKVLPTNHPQAVNYNWSLRPVVLADLAKAHRESRFPDLRRPERQVLVEPTLEQIERWVDSVLTGIPPKLLACDIETAQRQITCIGFSRSRDDAMVVPFWDRSKPGWSYWATASEELRAWKACEALLSSDVPKVGQNFIYDMQYLLPMGLKLRNIHEDTMLLHHSLFPEMQKGLGFLGSVYTSEPAWKLMRRKRADTTKADE